MRSLSNKDMLVLGFMRDHIGESFTCKSVALAISKTLPCTRCSGTGAHHDHRTDRIGNCHICHGRGHLWFGYGDAYTALRRLERLSHVERRQLHDEFGDPLRTFMWTLAIPTPNPADPLEALYQLPSHTTDG